MTSAAAESFDPQLLRTLRAAPWRTIEKRFLVILAGSIALHIAFAAYVAHQPTPAIDEQLDDVPDRFAAQVMKAPLLPIPKAVLAVAASPVAAAPTSVAPRKAVDPSRAAQAAVVRILGSGGPNGAFKDLLGAPNDEIAQALEGATGLRVSGIDPIGPKGPATGEAATIARMGTDGVKSVTLGSRSDRAPATAIAGPITVDDPDNIDPRVLQQFITARRAAVQSCYERELHHNPAMKGGKVVLRMAIGTTGRVSGISVEEDTLGSPEVTACMSTLMGRWIFPVTPKDELPLSVPFVFARAN